MSQISICHIQEKSELKLIKKSDDLPDVHLSRFLSGSQSSLSESLPIASWGFMSHMFELIGGAQNVK